jgi:gluconolactonase
VEPNLTEPTGPALTSTAPPVVEPPLPTNPEPVDPEPQNTLAPPEPTAPESSGGAGPSLPEPPPGGAPQGTAGAPGPNSGGGDGVGGGPNGGGGGASPVGGASAGGSGGEAPMTSFCSSSPGTPPTGELTATLITEIQVEGEAFHLFEGPAWIGDTLYFSDISFNDVRPWQSTLRTFVPGTRAVANFLVDADSNGLAVAADGTLYSATSGKKEISRYTISPPGQQTAVAGPFNSPNDIAVAADGTIYFSDPQQSEITAGNLPEFVHVVKDGVDGIFSEELQAPNGVTLSPEQDVLYVSGGGESGYLRKVTLVDGLAGSIEELESGLQAPDGMTVDCAGNVYLAVHEGRRIDVFSPSGDPLASIPLGVAANGEDARPTNVAFGGPDRKTLYITAVFSLWEVQLDIAGYPY